ncbi:DUF1801 domain-containing protein [Kocuria sp.]|uniref:DUF1801 domain-containing protein n=1 Tax=Kocuria sp. TaxID=1871328 RepID=UPI0026DF6FDF|nr:DUF1801 domain-containing protein [Kocuria sp.]MDO5618138.1 DUF1801 domain-containing protein [Kocuria sp.]
MSTSLDDVAGLGNPARSALRAAGYNTLEDLNGVAYKDLLALHGVGARGLERAQGALVERGLSLDGAPVPQDRSAVVTPGNTGIGAADLKTHPTAVEPAEFIRSLESPRRVQQGLALLAMFNQVTGEQPVMWGPSMIGYGQVHYRYATGREGDTFHMGFSPRKAAISLYGLQNHPRSEELLSRLGKHRTAVSCIYINQLHDVDQHVLRKLLTHAWEAEPKVC